GLRDPQKPQGAFLFAGPTGVGKTELARALADRLGIHLARFDMSEYQEAHTVARLIGAPPGYVGFDQGGLLTDAVAKHPHSVVLLDEIEKAHPDVYNVFLQLMDHGTLTDHTGKKVDGRGVILIFTTNAGAADASRPALGFGRVGRAGEEAEAVRRTFTPEFRNRLDAVLHFAPLSQAVMGGVVDKFIRELQTQLAERGVTVTVSPAARARLAELGYDPAMGARPLGRVIETRLKRPLADELLFGRLKGGGTVKVGVRNGEFTFS
ncbi:AAA family ATPase, partial [Deinococcus sp. 23YEL01]|uniref:AAA family ATPase n=1 Tax=Deinococcus sp. 23YEL01 TaxID=2745871 RepID=UPI001E5884D1